MSTGTPSRPSAGPVLAHLDRPRTETPVRFAVVSDVHLTSRKTGTWKVLHRTPARLETAIDDINTRGVSYVQFLGDLTSGGSRHEFRQFRASLRNLDVPYGAVPGNHDVPKRGDGPETASLSQFETRYAPDGFPTSTTVGELTLVGLNSASLPDGSLRETWEGAVSADQLSRLSSLLADAERPVVFLHHNLGALPEHPTAPPWTWFPANNASAVVDLLERHGVELVFSGHHHLFDRVSRRTITEVYAPATCSFPQSYLIVDVGSAGTDISLVPLADRAAVEEAFWAARLGDPLGRGVLSMVESRLGQLSVRRTS